MPDIDNYSESRLKSDNDVTQYSREERHGVTVIKYSIFSRNAGAEEGALIGTWWGPVGAAIGAAIGAASGKTYDYTKYFDQYGNYMGDDQNTVAEKLNEKAWQAYNRSNFETAKDLFNNAYLICTSGYRNESNFRNNRDMANQKIEEDKKRKEAELKAREEVERKQKEAEKTRKAQNLFQQGKQSWDTAWTLENSDRDEDIEKAGSKFQDAKSKFQQALSMYPYNKEYSKWSQVSDLKISGNDFFNQGLNLQQEANKLKEQQKFQEALAKYRQSLSKFQEGLAKSGDFRFQSSIDFVQESIIETSTAIQKFDVDQAHNTLGNVNIEGKPQQNTQQSGNKEQVTTEGVISHKLK